MIDGVGVATLLRGGATTGLERRVRPALEAQREQIVERLLRLGH